MTEFATEGEAKAGTRVRERRISLGVKQSDLAQTAGISASYLNLIEHNRRRIGGKLLASLARGLDVDAQFLIHGAEADLIESLRDASLDAKDDLMPESEAAHPDEFAERYPGWAALLSAQRKRIVQLEATIDGLNDRLTHDPVLSETMHDVLSTASAIRSTASILVATPDIDAEWRQRFHTNIDTESRRLAETSAAMAEHFETLTKSSGNYVTPLEAVQALFDAASHHFPSIEAGGVAAIGDILNETQLAGAARRLAQTALTGYAKRAALFPMAKLTDELTTHSLTRLTQLATDACAPLDDLLIRLAELPHDPKRPEMGCVQCDSAGALVIRNEIAAFPIPKFGAACNLWPLFATMSQPNTPLRQIIRMTDGTAVTTYCVATVIRPATFDKAALCRATMLVVADAPEGPAQEVGRACRVCSRNSCEARREPSILDTYAPQSDP